MNKSLEASHHKASMFSTPPGYDSPRHSQPSDPSPMGVYKRTIDQRPHMRSYQVSRGAMDLEADRRCKIGSYIRRKLLKLSSSPKQIYKRLNTACAGRQSGG